MSFGDHLEELRTRLVRALIALAVSILALMPFKDKVTEIHVAPYHTMWLQGSAITSHMRTSDSRHWRS